MTTVWKWTLLEVPSKGRLILFHSNFDTALSKMFSKVPVRCLVRTAMTCPEVFRSTWGML